jgi:hypothetical protein
MVTVTLNAVQILIGIIIAVGSVGFQIGLYWTFKTQVEIKLKAHDEKLAALDKAREATTLVLTKISLGVEGLDVRLSEMKTFCAITENGKPT